MYKAEQSMPDRQADINRAFGRMYFAIYSVDLESGKYLEVSTLDIFKEHIPSTGDNRHLFNMVVKYYVSDGYKDSMRHFLNMNTLQERLSLQNAVSNEFFGTTQGWCRANLVAEKRDEKGKVLRFIYVTQEINQEVKSEQERIAELKRAYSYADAANHAKTDFLFRMSHDIRTPLHAIMGFNDLLLSQPDMPDKAYDYAEKIRASGDLLMSLLDGIFDVSQLENGDRDFTQSVFSMRKLINDLEVVLRSYSENKNQRFSLVVDTLPHRLYIGDKACISRTLFDILNNAVKFTPDGGVVCFEVHNSSEHNSDGSDEIVFIIRDNGIGISEEEQANIFDMPLVRAGEISRHNSRGTSLPLAKHFAELSGGSLTLKSKLGEGSEFVLRLPLKYSKEADEATTETKDVLSELHVLVVEDNDLNMEIVTELLEMSGSVCETAKSGLEAVEKIEKLSGDMYDLVLMDVRMPEMDGYEATRRIRAMNDTAKANVPIVALSANNFDEDVENAKKSGMNAHLSKPLDMKRLRETVKDLL